VSTAGATPFDPTASTNCPIECEDPLLVSTGATAAFLGVVRLAVEVERLRAGFGFSL
jgi:hypothetical protein